MSETDGAAVDVDLVVREAEQLCAGHGHRRERLVDLGELEVADLDTGQPASLGNGEARRGAGVPG